MARPPPPSTGGDRAARRRAARSPEAGARAAPTEQDRRDAIEARIVAVVIVAAMVLWLGGLWLGGHFGWEARYAFLIDFAAIAAFVWSMVVMWRIWRRQASRSRSK